MHISICFTHISARYFRPSTPLFLEQVFFFPDLVSQRNGKRKKHPFLPARRGQVCVHGIFSTKK